MPFQNILYQERKKTMRIKRPCCDHKFTVSEDDDDILSNYSEDVDYMMILRNMFGRN